MEKEKLNIGRKSAFSQPLKVDRKGVSFDDYGAKPLVEIDAEDTMYNTFRKTAKKRMDNICIRHNKVEKTYSEILNMADNFAAYLSKIGIHEGDIVALPLKNCIEAAVSLIAINKIGAISKWMDTDKSAKEFYDDLNKCNFKYIIADNGVRDKLNKYSSELNITKDNSLYVDSNNYDNNSDFSRILDIGKNYDIDSVQYSKDKPSLIITSSGSTGLPKEIIHSNFSVNSAVKKITYTDYPIKDNIMTVVIPPFIGLGLVTSLYSSMICGGEAEIISDYTNPFVFVEYIKSNKEKWKKSNKKVLFFGAPMYYKTLLMKIDELEDLSFVGTFLAAGSKIEKDQLLKMDTEFFKKGCRVPVCNAYGQNEHCGGITYNTIKSNKQGSAGKVAYGTRVMIVNPKTKEELPVNQVGKIVEQSDSQFLGYNNNKAAEKASEFIDNDGEKWFDTKDLGSFDEDNFLHIFDREGRAIIRFDNKVSLAKVENKILKNSIFDDVIVVKVEAPGPFGIDQAPFAFVTTNGEEHYSYDEIIDKIQLGDYPFTMLEMPVWIEYISKNAIPYKNAKINYKKLEEVAQRITNEIINQKVLDELSKEKIMKLDKKDE